MFIYACMLASQALCEHLQRRTLGFTPTVLNMASQDTSLKTYTSFLGLSGGIGAPTKSHPRSYPKHAKHDFPRNLSEHIYKISWALGRYTSASKIEPSVLPQPYYAWLPTEPLWTHIRNSLEVFRAPRGCSGVLWYARGSSGLLALSPTPNPNIYSYHV